MVTDSYLPIGLGQGKVIEKTLSGKVLGIVPIGGAEVTIGRTFELEFNLRL